MTNQQYNEIKKLWAKKDALREKGRELSWAHANNKDTTQLEKEYDQLLAEVQAA